MHQSHRHERDVTIAPQEIPTPAQDSGELAAAALALVVGGGQVEPQNGDPDDPTPGMPKRPG
jgi:hypothetical protein